MRRNKKMIPVVAVFILIGVVILLMLCGNFLKRYIPTKETEDLSEYYGLTSEEEMGVVLNDALLEAKGIYVDGKAYLDYQTIHDHINERFYWDANENVLLYTTPSDLITVSAGRLI